MFRKIPPQRDEHVLPSVIILSTGTRHQRNHDETRNNDQLGMRIDYIGPEIAGCERQLILRFYAPDRSQETSTCLHFRRSKLTLHYTPKGSTADASLAGAFESDLKREKKLALRIALITVWLERLYDTLGSDSLRNIDKTASDVENNVVPSDLDNDSHGPNDHTTDEDAASVSTKVDNPHKLSLHNNLSCHSKPNVQHINTHGLLCRRKRLSAWVQRCKMCELQSSLRPRKWADWAKRLVLMLRRVHGAQTRDWPVDALGMPLRQVDSVDGSDKDRDPTRRPENEIQFQEMVRKNIQIRIRISASMTASHGSVFAVETGSTPVFGTNSFSPLVSSISRRVQAGATFLDVKVKELKSCQVNRKLDGTRAESIL
ncbi:hypothetical protein PSTG_09208 [Puccinia striiformis f. sp. tritici PST-78]|uniref:Uncharacterized protein n=1 Tax=Puccinia striiformis f. sp. tritici PST-78 TaxID=1165861 RepID=A0A0L0VE24_9BASI|nr:hypothetical protein PSTG_09208 [Puccinia striiformis f. sp. tritici PST-78]